MSFKSTIFSYTIITISLIIRIYKLENNIYIKWDESHTLNHAKHYLNNTFHLDVHPPLGKILFSLLGRRSNLDLKVDYKTGDLFPSQTNWLFLKYFNVLIGGLIPLVVFKSLRLLVNNEPAFCIALLVAFENFFIFLSRLIVLDNLFLLSNVLVIYYYLVKNQLIMLGIFLGLTISIKLCGILTYFCILGLTLYDFRWKRRSKKTILKYFYTLILIPAKIYVLTFVLHFYLLTKPSNDLTIMSSNFTSRFYNHNIYSTMNSILSIKNEKGKLIHLYKYPSTETSKIIDIKPLACATFYDSTNSKIRLISYKPKRIESKDYITIYFPINNLFLEVKNNNSIIEVTGVEDLQKGCLFQIRSKNEGLIFNFKTQVSLYNIDQKCYLNISDKLRHGSSILVCTKKQSYWTLEQSNFKETKTFFYSFLDLFIENNLKMLSLNNSLNQSKHSYASKAKSWMFNLKGIKFKLPNNQYLMIGNTFTWYLSSICFISTLTFNYKIINLGFLMNYLPYFCMNRTLYIHNYIPAYLFGIMSIGFLFKKYKYTRFLVILAIINFFRTKKNIYGF